jgi:quinol monooxygenase YgiN
MLGFTEVSCRLAGLHGPGKVPGLQPRRLVSGQFAIIRDSGHSYQSAATLHEIYPQSSRSALSNATMREREGMLVNIDMFSIRRRVRVFAVLFLAMLGLAGWARAQESGARERIYVVTHVDVTPDNAAAGTKLLQQYAAETRKEKGVVRVEAFVQVSRINHFTLVEVWQTRQALDVHEGAAHTKQFREQIQPMLGSPYDERLHQLVE